MEIKVNVSDPAKVRALKDIFSLDLLSATVLERRGVENAKDALFYLESDMIYQHSPLECDDVFTAIERINEAIEEKEKILIFGDRDVDGITGTAILYRGLKKLGAENLSYRLPEGDEPYGLTGNLVDEIISNEYSLLITVDNGISAVDEILALERSGVDVIVLDHHIPGAVLPSAVALFDPKIPGSGYPFDSLSGCAVAAKMIWALAFSRTPLFGSDCIVLHAEPRNGSIRINAVRLENLIEIDRITEEVADGGGFSQAKDRLMSFLAVNLPIIVLDADTEKKMLYRAFGKGVDIMLEDMRPKLESLMPKAKGHSIFDLAMLSKAARYHDGDKEIETLVSLFRSISIYSYPAISREYDELMEFAAIGTIADLMPMKDENRLIVKRGLKMLSSKPLDCFKPLLGRQNLAGKKLSGCLHCGACKKDGTCSLGKTDDCEAAFSAMLNASLVLWLSPVYFYGLPAQAKALIDRSQRFYESRACEHNKAANALCPRALSLFVSGRRKGDMLFAGSHLALKYFFAALGIPYAGSLALRGLEAPSDIGAETEQDLLRAAKILAHSIEKDCPDIASAITKACPRIENALPA